jgi:mRNA interferase MazF
MKRGELYRVAHPSGRDPKKYRVFVIVSRQVVIDSRFSTVICAPIYRWAGDASSNRPR